MVRASEYRFDPRPPSQRPKKSRNAQDPYSWGQQLAAERRRQGYTQAQAARLVGRSWRQWVYYEHNHSLPPWSIVRTLIEDGWRLPKAPADRQSDGAWPTFAEMLGTDD